MPEDHAPAVPRGRGLPSLAGALLAVLLVLITSWWLGVRPVALSAERTGDQGLAEALAPHLSGTGTVSVAAWTGDGEVRYAGFGADASSAFEIGSITKTFTGALLMDAVERGEVTLDTTVADILGDRVAGAPVADVTMRELASHSSGLARDNDSLASAMRMLLRKDPFGLDADGLIELVLADPLITRGTFSYSNLGISLLGHLLTQQAGMSYPEQLQQRLLEPMGLMGTHLAGPGEPLRDGEPAAMTATGQHAAPFTDPAIAPAGMLRSNAADLASWVRSVQDGSNPGARGLEPIVPVPALPGMQGGSIGVTWISVPASDGGTITWHNGGTWGFGSFAGYHHESGRGVIILANAAREVPTSLGMSILNGEITP